MHDIFENPDEKILPLKDWISLCQQGSIYLPSLQRNYVWNPKQVELLWDSLLRGFPIGAFLLQKASKEKALRELGLNKTQTIIPDDKPRWFIVDGQQRTTTLLTGLLPLDHHPYARLWIDIGAIIKNESLSNKKMNRRFLFRLCTQDNPWGFLKNTPEKRLKKKSREKARKIYILNQYKVLKNRGKVDPCSYKYYKLRPSNDDEISLTDSWPFDAKFPIPFFELWALYKKNKTLSGWEYLLPKSKQALLNKELSQSNSNIDKDRIQEILIPALTRLERKNMILLKMPEEDIKATETKPAGDSLDDLEELFIRCNAGGTRIEGEELIFSMVKSRFSEAHDVVLKIEGDSAIPPILSSSGYITTAARLVRNNKRVKNSNNEHYSDKSRISPIEFRQMLNSRPGEKDNFENTLKTFIHKPNSDSRLHQLLTSLCSVIEYKEKTNDAGIPRLLFPLIRKYPLHDVLFWMDKRSSNGTQYITAEQRQDILRYLIWVSFFVVDAKIQEKISKIAFEKIATSKCRCYQFPGKEIYNQAIQDLNIVPFPKPNTIKNLLDKYKFFYWGNKKQILKGFNKNNQGVALFLHQFWDQKNKSILLWFQRENMTVWFKNTKNFSPKDNSTNTRPYDFDHIVPQKQFDDRGKGKSIYDDLKANKIVYQAALNHYKNSIGNLWVLPDSDNRSFGDKPIRKKVPFIIGHKSVFTKPILNRFHRANPDKTDWNKIKATAFLSAVRGRVYWLYKTLYETLEYDKW